MHFGRGGAAHARASEKALVDCLRAHEDAVERLYLVGDVFDGYVEYRHLIPKGFVRFQGLLAAWADRGVPITYLVGNHDPWHRDYFVRELGVRLVFDHLLEPLYDRNVYLTHGDARTPTQPLYNRLKPWLRHPLLVWLYRTLLPGDLGYGLAQWVSRNFSTEKVNEELVAALREHARQVLREGPADVVVMGHCHRSELTAWPEGAYLNPGCWDEQRTFGRLDEDGLKLLHWDGQESVEWRE